MRTLELLAGAAQPKRLVMEDAFLAAGIQIGRLRDAHVRILSETASRRHAQIEAKDGRIVLSDLGSANGTYLNGERLKAPAALFDGDVLVIGEVQLRYRCGEDADRDTAVLEAESGAVVEAHLDPTRADPAAQAEGEDAVRRLRLVCKSARVASEAATPTELAERVLERLITAFEPDRATVFLQGPDARLEVLAGYPEAARPPASTTIRRRVIEGGEAILIRDAHDREQAAGNPSLVRSRFRSTLAAPFRAGKHVVGGIAVEHEAADASDAADLEALAAVAHQAGLALRNLWALGEARAAAASLARGHNETPDILGASAPMEALRTRIRKAAAVGSPVLILGATGTGKELVARHIHAQSDRARAPFVAVNSAAIVEGLLESELFGHEAGSFTGATERREGRIERAGAGTLFLDEIGELSPTLQAKLLRVLAERTYQRVGGSETLPMQCRVIAATHRDLRQRVEERSFREDLYYRLAVLVVQVPALRERADDLPLLVHAFVERSAARLGRRVPRVSDEAMARLEQHSWPGNVRELQNVVERALVLLDGDVLEPDDLPEDVGTGLPPSPVAAAAGPESLAAAERRAVVAALRSTGGRKGEAAQVLGIAWPTLTRKIRQHGVSAHEFGGDSPS